MPILPELSAGGTYTKKTQEFKGYNHNMAIADGEWYDCEGLSSDNYPLFGVRKPMAETIYSAYTCYTGGLYYREGLCYLDGLNVLYKGQVVQGIALKKDHKRKTIVGMGDYVCIFPDGVWFKATDPHQCGTMDAHLTYTGTVKADICKLDGTPYSNVVKSDTAPENPTENMHWLDTGSDPHALKVWSSSAGYWQTMATTYVRIEVPGAGAMFSAYDAISLSGLDANEQLRALCVDGVYLYGMDGDAIIIAGLLDQSYEGEQTVTLDRNLPYMEYVCEHNNRLWGCSAKTDKGTETTQEIYCCKLGDMKNWYCYTGLSTDSYAVTVGSPGPFTGICAYGGSVLAFKENIVYKVYGTQPSSFQMSSINCRGIMDGCGHSLKVIGENIYYKSRTDVCVFDGSSQPVSISDNLGNVQYDTAVAGKNGSKYLISMRKTSTGTYELYEYDTKKKVWHRLNTKHMLAFSDTEDETYAMDSAGYIWTMNGTVGEPEGPVAWWCESGIIGYTNTYQEYVGRFEFRMKLEPGAWMALFIEYDSDGVWKPEGIIKRAGHGVFSIPVIPMRCDHFRIRLEGQGNVYIYTMVKTMEGGSTESWRTY